MEARLTDDLSGFSSATIRFESPSESQSANIYLSPNDRISGDELDGIYEDKMTLPQNSEPGTWKLDYISLYDNVGNRRRLSEDDANALNFPTEFYVESVGDTEPPDVLSFDFDPRVVDTTTSYQRITVTTRLTDELSGFSSSTIRFKSPSERQSVSAYLSFPNRISGDMLDGIYEGEMTLLQYSEPGTWELDYISLYDNVGNRKQLSQSDAVALVFPTEFEVVSLDDTEPPEVLNFGFDPKAVDSATSSQKITLTTHLIDNLSGFSSGNVRFKSPSEGQSVSVSLSPLDRISGDELDGVYEDDMTIPQYSELGTWKLDYLSLRDWGGSRRQLSQVDVAALGFPTKFRNGYSGPLSISGIKFNDLDNNGAKDAGESGLPGWTIELLLGGNLIDTIETAADGTYSFDYLAPGSYTVREVQQAGWVQTCPPGGSHSVDLVDVNSKSNDFGNHQIMSEDTKPPDIMSFDFSPKAVDTSASSQEITVTARLTDDLSGFSQGYFRFQSPSKIQDVGLWFSSSERTSGNGLDGIYERKITLPQYSEPGTWKLSSVELRDNVGNSKYISGVEVEALGIPTEFEVESVGDTTPPTIASFDFNPKAVDTSTSSQEITITARLTDDLSGFSQGYFRFQSPSKIQDVGLWFSSSERTSGNELDGSYERKITLPQYSEPGTWKLSSVELRDNVGNSKYISGVEVEALGIPTEFEVESVGDTKPPSVASFDFNPKAVDTSTSSREITVTARLTDDLSGFSQGYFRFLSPSKIQDVGLWFSSSERTSGNGLDGIYERKITLPQYSEPGTWKLSSIELRDNVGNLKYISGDDVTALGIPTTFRNGHSGSLSISGLKFNDLNNNGARDAGETGLPGWRIELILEGDVIDTIETTQDGTYSFDYLAPGSYTVREVQKPGWVRTHPQGGSHSVNLFDADSTGNDFGNHQIMNEDAEPPNLLGFDLNPKTIDVSASSEEITFTARLTDDLSGVDSAMMWICIPEGCHQRWGFSIYGDDLVSGDIFDGVYKSEMTIPR
ncbi:MAG: SdrD B-like domain-containing protein, partial [Candidatus Cloacimonetes bacterium]|nr:SdrD B-like domain-containing protein [Candidatus Cloacimonadota bacterium]